MNIDLNLLDKVLKKHGIEYDPEIYISEIYFNEEYGFYYIFYGDLFLAFDANWLDGDYDFMIPSSTLIDSETTIPGIAGYFELLSTVSGSEYYQSVKPPKPINIGVNSLNKQEYEIFKQLVPNNKKMLDELVLADKYEWENIHSLEDIYISDDGTTDIYLMSQLKDPKYGCSFHQNRLHSKSGKTEGIPTIAEAKRDGYQWPNCRHTMKPFYPGYSRVPADVAWTLYELSDRARLIKNSEKIRNRQKTLSKIDPKKDPITYRKKVRELEEIKQQGYIEEKIY